VIYLEDILNMKFGIAGTSIWQQNQALIEHLTLDRDTVVVELQCLKMALGATELICLSTCNRVEFLYVTDDKSEEGILHRLIDYFFCGDTMTNFSPNDFYHFTGKDAITHLFRTTASLESLVVGETQIASQFKDAYQLAVDNSLCGHILTNLSEEALKVSKKVRRETSIGEGAVSMASLAVKSLISKLDPETAEPVMALVGSGEMTVKLARYIKKTSVGQLLFVTREAV